MPIDHELFSDRFLTAASDWHKLFSEESATKRSNPQHSAKTAEHYSPGWVSDLGRNIMGEITTDPATSEIANRVVKARVTFTIADPEQAFRDPWPGCVFLNPPGGDQGRNVKRFWERLIDQYRAGIACTAFYVGFSLEQLLQLQNTTCKYCPLDFPIIYPRRRVSYFAPDGTEEKQPTHGSFFCLLPDLRNAQEQAQRLFHYGSSYGKVVWPSWTK